MDDTGLFELGFVDPNKDDKIFQKLKENFNTSRMLVFNDDVSDDLVESYVCPIIQWNREDEDIPVEKRKPIKILINSGGGDVFSANALIGAILTSKTPVYTVGFGMVASAAYMIYVAGHVRYAFPYTSFLQHDGETQIANSSGKAKDTMDFMNRMSEETKDLILSRTNISEEDYDKNYEKEWWMQTVTAKELNVVQKIIGQDCEISEIL